MGIMNAMYPLGEFFGVFRSAFLGDRFGSKFPMYLGLSLLLGAALQGAAQSIPMFIVVRLILGFVYAFISRTAPILVSAPIGVTGTYLKYDKLSDIVF